MSNAHGAQSPLEHRHPSAARRSAAAADGSVKRGAITLVRERPSLASVLLLRIIAAQHTLQGDGQRFAESRPGDTGPEIRLRRCHAELLTAFDRIQRPVPGVRL